MSTAYAPSALSRAAQILGSQAAVARACGLRSRRNVWPWFAGTSPIPVTYCPQIERATRGLVSCEELRPDAAWVRVRDDEWPAGRGRPCVDIAKAA